MLHCWLLLCFPGLSRLEAVLTTSPRLPHQHRVVPRFASVFLYANLGAYRLDYNARTDGADDWYETGPL